MCTLMKPRKNSLVREVIIRYRKVISRYDNWQHQVVSRPWRVGSVPRNSKPDTNSFESPTALPPVIPAKLVPYSIREPVSRQSGASYPSGFRLAGRNDSFSGSLE